MLSPPSGTSSPQKERLSPLKKSNSLTSLTSSPTPSLRQQLRSLQRPIPIVAEGDHVSTVVHKTTYNGIVRFFGPTHFSNGPLVGIGQIVLHLYFSSYDTCLFLSFLHLLQSFLMRHRRSWARTTDPSRESGILRAPKAAVSSLGSWIAPSRCRPHLLWMNRMS